MIQQVLLPSMLPITEYRLADHVALAMVEDGTSRLLNLGGHFYALSETGTAMVHEVLHADSARAVVNLAAQFRARPERVAHDLREFLNALEQQRLLIRGGSSSGSPAARSGWAGRLLYPVFQLAKLKRLSLAARARILLHGAYWSLRWFGWPATLTAWQKTTQQFPSLSPEAGAPAPERHARAVEEAIRHVAAHSVCKMECKERAMACWMLLRMSHYPARMIVGIDLYPFTSHAWCVLGSQILTDYPDRCQRYTPIWTYA